MKTLIAILITISSLNTFAAGKTCKVFLENKDGISFYGGNVSNSDIHSVLSKKGYELVDFEDQADVKVRYDLHAICYLMEGDVSEFALRMHDLLTADGYLYMSATNLSTGNKTSGEKKVHNFKRRSIVRKIKKLSTLLESACNS